MVENIPSVMARMILSELKQLRTHLDKGVVHVTNQNQRKMIDEELNNTIAKRREAIETNERKKEKLDAKAY